MLTYRYPLTSAVRQTASGQKQYRASTNDHQATLCTGGIAAWLAVQNPGASAFLCGLLHGDLLLFLWWWCSLFLLLGFPDALP